MDKMEVEMQDLAKSSGVTIQPIPNNLPANGDKNGPGNVSYSYTSSKSGKINSEQMRIRVRAVHMVVG